MRYTGTLYYEEFGGVKRPLAQFDVEAESRIKAIEKVLDKEWDARLDAADCAPVFEWDEIPGRVRVEVSYAEALAVSDLLGVVLQHENRCVTPATYTEALKRAEEKFGIGCVVLALRQVVGFLRRELGHNKKVKDRWFGIRSSIQGYDDFGVLVEGLSGPLSELRAEVPATVAETFDRLKLQPKVADGVGQRCTLCDEIIAEGEVALQDDGDGFAHLCCVTARDDGDYIDREHGDS